MSEFVALRLKKYSYLRDDCYENKKAIDKKRCFVKQKFKFDDYKALCRQNI